MGDGEKENQKPVETQVNPKRISTAAPPFTPLRPTGGGPDAYRVRQRNAPPPKPDWNYWSQMIDVPLWRAVALSSNCDPRRPEFQTDWDEPDEIYQSKEIRTFIDRLDIAKSHLGRTLKHTSLNRAYPNESQVDLSKFAAWTLSRSWDLPEPFAKLAATSMSEQIDSPTSGEAAKQWPWGTYDTPMLRKMASAIEKFWIRYDPSDPSTAPRNEDVAAWLETQGVSQRNAEVIATLIRADGLRTGPR